MKSKLAPFFAAIGLIILIIAGFFGMRIAGRYISSDEWVDKNELLNVQGEETAIFLNSELQVEKGICKDEYIYLPLAWVNEHLNQRFYWDNIEKVLVYTLPDNIVYADKRTMGSSGKPLLLVQKDEVYLSLGLISNYTDVQMKTFHGDEINRVFLDNTWESQTIASAKKNDKVREEAGNKNSIITEVSSGTQFRILEKEGDWSLVETPDGYIGYVKNGVLGGSRTVPQISNFEEPVYTSIELDEKVSLVWHQVLSKQANDNLEELMKNVKGVNVIAPTWFALTDNKGNYHSNADQSYVDKAHAMGMQVWVVLDNFNMGDNVRSEILFAQTSARKNLIEQLIKDVLYYNMDGINLDIEGFKPEAGPHYVQFIRELSVECRKHNIILSVDNYTPTTYTEFYNREEQGIVADYVIMMGYDEHHAGGEMGSVASLPYVAKGIEDMLEVVPKEKFICAIPFFTRVWTDKGDKTTSSALGLEGINLWIEENNVELYWQEELGQYYGELETDAGTKFVWMEDEESIRLKMKLIQDNDLAGVGIWKLGFDTDSIWDVVQVNK